MRSRSKCAIGLALSMLVAACTLRSDAQQTQVRSVEELDIRTVQQLEGCAESVSAQVRIDQGHPWKSPFGIDRVGKPLSVHVELTTQRHGLRFREYSLVGYRGGVEMERHLLNVLLKPDTAYFTSFPEEIALVARCGFMGRPEELTRQSVSWPDFEADAVAHPDRRINPVDLGTILVPHDWLLLAGGQTAVVTAAAISHTVDLPNARLRAWFQGGRPTDIAMPLLVNRRVTHKLYLPLSSSSDHVVLHVSLTDGVAELWKKEIRTMIVAQPPRWPSFGAVGTKLRYDAPISVKDPQTGALSEMEYDTAWDPRLHDVVVFLPNGSRFVFWRGSSYVPFWAGQYNTGVCYQWAENVSQPDGTVDVMEPLMDKELRYGRVRIIESTRSRVHVRWTYQLADFLYQVRGEQATEDFYFYPDGFGTRVLTLTSTPGDVYHVSEFIVLTPQSAFPFEVLPSHIGDVLFLDGKKKRITFPFPPGERDLPTELRLVFSGKVTNPQQQPMMYRIFINKNDPAAAIYFNPRDPTTPVAFKPFYDRGQLVTPTYWGSHWPLSRGKMTGAAIDDQIYSSPAHNSLLAWIDWPKPLSAGEFPVPDASGRSRAMPVHRWAWLIAKTDAPDEVLLEWAESYSDPPSLEVTGARIDFPSYSPERRAMRLIAESPSIEIKMKPVARTINPVFELDQAPKELASATIDGKPLRAEAYAWDGATLWVEATIGASGATIGLRFR